MDLFEYLLVMVSVIMGMGVSHLLSGVGRLIQAQQHVRLYWVPLVWVGLLFILHVQIWWSSWRWQDFETWSFPTFVFVLLLPIVLYLLAGIIVPDFDPDSHEAIDMYSYYFEKRPWIFGIGCLIPLIPLVEGVAFFGLPVFCLRNLFRLTFLLLFVGGAVLRTPRYHGFLALLLPGLYFAYIGFFNLELQ